MEDYRSTLNKFWQTVGCLQRGGRCSLILKRLRLRNQWLGNLRWACPSLILKSMRQSASSKGGWDTPRVPQVSECWEVVVVDTYVQHFNVVLDSVVYQWGGTSFKRGDQRVCSNYSWITFPSHPRKVYPRVLERRIRPIVAPQFQKEQYSLSTCSLLVWRRHLRISLMLSCMGALRVCGLGFFAKGCWISL